MASDGETTCTNDPNFAVIYSFLKVFGKLYGLEIPTITKLQEFVENTEEVPEPLRDIHVRLLRRALKSVQPNRWERCLIKFCHHQGYHQEAWEVERFSYKKASTQIKLKVLKILLEYQFTCHGKFKSAVNALSCKDLRLDPVGTDMNGCVFWLQVDDEANLRLYKEDLDEETWQLVARNRDEFVTVIEKLKSREEVGISAEPNITNEDSNSAEVPPQLPEINSEVKTDEENEEFLSPESESDPDTVEAKEPDSKTCDTKAKDEDQGQDNEPSIGDNMKTTEDSKEQNVDSEKEGESSPNDKKDIDNTDSISTVASESNHSSNSTETENKTSTDKTVEQVTSNEIMNLTEPGLKEDTTNECKEVKVEKSETIERQPEHSKTEEAESKVQNDTIPQQDTNTEITEEDDREADTAESKEDITVSETIEEPVMHITGEGSGVDCESSYFIGEEIEETVMYFWGEGYGYENDTGNPDVIEENNTEEDTSKAKNTDHSNGGCVSDLGDTAKLGSSIKLRSSQISVAKRSLKNVPTDGVEPLKSDPKKHCVRDLEKSDSSSSVCNDKSNSKKQNKRKTKSKVKKTSIPSRKIKLQEGIDIVNAPVAAENCNDSKATIIEKRKSSISSSDHDEEDHTDNDRDQSPEKEAKIEDPLPSKKLKLEKSLDSNDEDHPIKANDEENREESASQQKNGGTRESPKNSVLRRKTIKASRGKFKRKNLAQMKNREINEKNYVKQEESDSKQENESPQKKTAKSLKRSLIDAQSDKNKSESQSESEEEEQATLGKRLKIKPKKIITTSRKKVEAKLKNENTSDESEEETLYSLAGKKNSKKALKKRSKSGKARARESAAEGPGGRAGAGRDDEPRVRQSRRIAQLKIREEAQRRHQEEVALRELKIIHKKKSTCDDEDEDEWRMSGRSSASDRPRPKRGREWRASESTPPPSDSDSEPIYEPEREEPDLDFTKSDHEFSPESDLECSEPVEPTKLARTLQEGKDEGYCRRCGSGEQPEWILLCDACDDGYHAACLKPVLFLVPAGDWWCPRCQHAKLIASLEQELVKYDEFLKVVEEERQRKKLEEPEVPSKRDKEKPSEETRTDSSDSGSGSSSGSGSWSSSESEGAVYRLRERRQLPVSYRAREYDRLISSAIKEEYVEATSSAGNQGRGKDISTIIEAAEEEKLKAEQEAIDQGKPVEKPRRKPRRKPRKLNSLEVLSEDDDTDEDFKDTGMESTSEDISSDAERDSPGSRSSDSLPISRACANKDRPPHAVSSSGAKKKGVFKDSSSESSDGKLREKQSKSKSRSKKKKRSRSGSKKGKRRRGLTQYDAAGNVVRARIAYGLGDGGGGGGGGRNDWSPKHRTRQKKINYTETPNTESEEEMHKSSGKHMADSSDEFRLEESEVSSDSEAGRRHASALSELVSKTAVVPLEKLSEELTRAKTEELAAHLSAQSAAASVSAASGSAACGSAAGGSAASVTPARPARGKGSRGGRGSRGPRGRGRGAGGARPSAAGDTDESLSKLVGIKIKDLGQSPDGTPTPNQIEKEKKRLEREAKLAEKEARKLERLQKKEEKDKIKEQKAKEREDKRVARLALQESKRLKKERPDAGAVPGFPVAPLYRPAAPGPPGPAGPPHRPGPPGPPGPQHYSPDQRFGPRLQVRAELRAMRPDLANVRAPHPGMREGTLSVAGSPQPFAPAAEEPSVITRMPHMMNHQYRGPMMFGAGGAAYGYRAPGAGFHATAGRFPPPPPGYYSAYPRPPPDHDGRPLPPGGSPLGYASPPGPTPGQIHPHPGLNHPPGPPHGPNHGLPGSSHGPPGLSHGPSGSSHGPPGTSHGPPGGHGPPGPNHIPYGSSHGSLGLSHGPPGSRHGPPGSSHGPPGSSHGPPGSSHGPPGSSHGPLGLSHGPLGSSHGPPGSSHGPLGSSHGPPGSNHGPLGSNHGPPGSSHGPLRSSHGPPGSSHGPPGSSHGPPCSSHGPPGSSHGPHGSNNGRPGSHGPPGNHAPPGLNYGPLGSSHGPPGLSHGPSGLTRGPPGSRGPPGPSHGSDGQSHGPPGPNHGHGQGHPGLIHGLPGHGQLHGPPRHPLGSPLGQAQGHGPPGHPAGSPSGQPPGHGPPFGRGPGQHEGRAAPRGPAASPGAEPVVKIKAEVKTEPESSRDGSPPAERAERAEPRAASPARDDAPRLSHPKIKHTDGKDRRPRYPLGPYAPQYGPYGPYAPPPPESHSPAPQALPPHPQHRLPLHQFHPSVMQNLAAKSAHAERPRSPARHPAELHAGYPHYAQLARPHFGPPRAPAPGSAPAPFAPHPGLARPPEPAPSQSLPRETVLPVTSPPTQAATESAAAPSAEREASTPPVDLHKPVGDPAARSPSPRPAPARPAEPEEQAARSAEPEPESEPAPAPHEGSVFGGLVSYFSSQREDDIDA